MSTFHYSNLRVKFEGEEGSGPGVNRGFFAAMANALKTDEKVTTLEKNVVLILRLSYNVVFSDVDFDVSTVYRMKLADLS